MLRPPNSSDARSLEQQRPEFNADGSCCLARLRDRGVVPGRAFAGRSACTAPLVPLSGPAATYPMSRDVAGLTMREPPTACEVGKTSMRETSTFRGMLSRRHDQCGNVFRMHRFVTVI